MKRSVAILVAMCLILSASAWADDAGKKKVILLNTNCASPDILGWNIDSTHFAHLLRANGFILKQKRLLKITQNELQGVDILLLIGPLAILDEDKPVLRQFLNDGGGILFGIYPNFGDAANIDSFTRDYGIWHGKLLPALIYSYIVESSPIAGTRACQVFYVQDPFSYVLHIDENKAEAVMINRHDNISAAISRSRKLGRGRLVVFGYDYMFYNGLIGLEDNRAIGLNVMDYLAGRTGPDLSLTNCRYKGKNLAGGDKIKVTVKIKNLGTSASWPTEISLMLQGSSSVQSSSSVTLDPLTLDAMEAGETATIQGEVKLPGTLAAGSYKLITTVDPEGWAGDANADNNSRTVKKTIVVN